MGLFEDWSPTLSNSVKCEVVVNLMQIVLALLLCMAARPHCTMETPSEGYSQLCSRNCYHQTPKSQDCFQACCLTWCNCFHLDPTEPGCSHSLLWSYGIHCPIHPPPSESDTPDPPLASGPVSSADCGARPWHRPEIQVHTYPPWVVHGHSTFLWPQAIPHTPSLVQSWYVAYQSVWHIPTVKIIQGKLGIFQGISNGKRIVLEAVSLSQVKYVSYATVKYILRSFKHTDSIQNAIRILTFSNVYSSIRLTMMWFLLPLVIW